MYWFGQNLKNKDDWKTPESWSVLAHLKRKMAMTNLDAIITLLDQFSQTWKP
jgi:hypothetical protein